MENNFKESLPNRGKIESDFSKTSKRDSEYSTDNNLKIVVSNNQNNNVVDITSFSNNDTKFNSLTKCIKNILITTTCILIITMGISIGFGIYNKHILSYDFENEYDILQKNKYPFLTNLVTVIIILVASISKL